jgi:outer membrane protein assembly factor BamD (BamD/ComL family)
VSGVSPDRDAASAITEEVSILRAANAELESGRPERALSLFDEHLRRFPSGALNEEREAGRILALCKAGRVDESREARSRFLREHPSSPQAARVRSACASDGN